MLLKGFSYAMIAAFAGGLVFTIVGSANAFLSLQGSSLTDMPLRPAQPLAAAGLLRRLRVSLCGMLRVTVNGS